MDNLSNLFEQFMELDGFVRLLIVLAATFIVGLLIKLIFGIKFKKRRASTILSMIGSILFFLVWFAGIIFALMQIGVDTTSILVGAGITGVILGLGSESIIADVLAGIFLIMDKDFQVGDTVALDDFRGEVVSMGIRTVSIRDTAGNVKIVRNSSIESVINQSKDKSVAIVRFPVSRDERIADVEKMVYAAIEKVYSEHAELFLAEPVYKGIDDLSTDLSSDEMVILITAEVSEAKIYDARRAVLRAVKVVMEECAYSESDDELSEEPVDDPVEKTVTAEEESEEVSDDTAEIVVVSEEVSETVAETVSDSE
ncbi:MAG: mechanosensitive ion channel [Oscillospiraceae bacterium]|nr:mechanosensitive ion channel [Oscillospiraceae bacterium]